ncbi:hypothetical protein [Ketobacter sp.]
MNNLVLLIISFLIGQGAMFLAQTFLLTNGDSERVASFGLNFSFLILFVQVIESGGTTILARRVIKALPNDKTLSTLSQYYTDLCVYRLILAASLLIAGLIYLVCTQTKSSFSYQFFFYSFPVLIISSFNLMGYLDGLRKSGLSGIVNGIPHLVAAIALLATYRLDSATAAIVLGCSVTLAFLTSLVLQYYFLVRETVKLKFLQPSIDGVFQASKSGLSMLLVLSPGQVFQRLQLLLCNTFLGLEVTSYFIYAKQITSGCNQMVAFSRRVEFPSLVEKILSERQSILTCFVLQKTSYLIAVSLFFFIFLLSGLVEYLNLESWYQNIWVVRVVCVTILTETFSGAFAQVAVAAGYFLDVGRIRVLAVIVSSFLSYFAVMHLGVYGLVVSELLIHVLVTSLSIRLLIKKCILQ